MTAVHLINILPTKTLNLNSPIEVLDKLFPKVRLGNGLIPRVFGCVCYVHTHHLSPDKLFVKGLKCVFVGYSNTQKGYKCYYPLTRKVIIAKDIVFNEQCFYYQTNSEPNRERDGIKGKFHTPRPFLSMRDQQETQLPQENQESTTKLDSQLATDGNNQPSTYPKYYVRRNKQLTTHPQDVGEDITGERTPEEDISIEESEGTELPVTLRKPTRTCVKPIPHSRSSYLNYDKVSINHKTFLSTLNQVITPTTLGEALQHPHWKKAMYEEM